MRNIICCNKILDLKDKDFHFNLKKKKKSWLMLVFLKAFLYSNKIGVSKCLIYLEVAWMPISVHSKLGFYTYPIPVHFGYDGSMVPVIS